jgi:hypothetical protein
MDTTTASSLRSLQDVTDYVTGGDSSDFIDKRFGIFVFVVAGSAVVILFVGMMVREYYWRKYGVDVCPTYSPRIRRQNSAELGRDRAVAQALQRQLNEEEREAERQVKRKERRTWYETYIMSFTMVSIHISSFVFFCCLEMFWLTKLLLIHSFIHRRPLRSRTFSTLTKSSMAMLHRLKNKMF